MHWPIDYHTKVKSERERQISYDIAYMLNLRKNIELKLQNINRPTDRKQPKGYQKGKCGGGIN